jgi:hypothetical protein
LLSHHGDRLPQTHCSEICGGHQHTKIHKDLSNSKNVVFNEKKLLSDGMDLMPWRKGRKSDASRMRAGLADFRSQMPVPAGERVNADIYQELL